MQLKALAVAAAMMALALAGCTSEPSSLAISFEQPEDPVTEAFKFSAAGPGDLYRWNFGDGTPAVEGANVEHTFGFTDGIVRISLLGVYNDGSSSESTSVDITLGSGINAEPTYDFRASSEWIKPGELFTLSTLGTTDADNDPILTRFECSVGAIGPPHIDNDPDSGKRGATPVDIDAWVTIDPTIPEGETVPGDFCAAYDFETNQEFTQTGAISGVLTEGAYFFEVEIKDPKTNVAYKSRAQLFVTEDKPDELPVFTIEGTLAPGVPDSLNDLCALDQSLCANVFTEVINLEMPLYNGTLTFELEDEQSSATYVFRRGQKELASGSNGDSVTFEAVDKPTVLTLEITYGIGLGSDFTVVVAGEYSIQPYLKYVIKR